jgi:glutamate dehydrogenase
MVRHAAAGTGADPIIARFKPAHDALAGHVAAFVPERLADGARAREASLISAGVPEPLARRVAYLAFEAAIPDIALVAEQAKQPLAVAAGGYFQVAERFEMARLAAAARAIPVRDYFDGLALDRAQALLAEAHRTLAVSALAHPRGLDGWIGERPHVARTLETISDILKGAEPTVSRYSVAAGLLADLTRG